MTKTVTICAAALAHGVEAAPNCRLALSRSRHPLPDCADILTALIGEVPVKAAKVGEVPVKAAKVGEPVKAPKAAPAPKVKATGLINSAGKVVLKVAKDVRTALTDAAKAAGGSRYVVEGFADSAAFLNGFPFTGSDKQPMILTVAATGGTVDAKTKAITLTIKADGTFNVA